MKQKQPKKLSKNQQLLKKYSSNRPTPAQEKKALAFLSKKNPDVYFGLKNKQINKDIKTATSKKKNKK